jgi:Holliday junction resolvase RusA-like endonuclease
VIFLHRVRLVIENEIPPSVNHYKVPIVIRGRISFKVTPEAKLFKTLIGYVARKAKTKLQPWNGETRNLRYRLRLVVYLGKKQRGDFDNFWKVVADGLKECGAIHSDDAVDDGHVYKRRDRERPRTEITVWSYMVPRTLKATGRSAGATKETNADQKEKKSVR